MSHTPIYTQEQRDARAREVAQDWPGAAQLWRTAAAQCPADSREFAYCTANAAACERVAAKVASAHAKPSAPECECPLRMKLQGAGDRKTLEGCVVLSAPFLDAALAAPCGCAELRQALASANGIVTFLQGRIEQNNATYHVELTEAKERIDSLTEQLVEALKALLRQVANIDELVEAIDRVRVASDARFDAQNPKEPTC